VTYWAHTAIIDGRAESSVRISHDAGRITAVEVGAAKAASDIELGTVMPGIANAHSHAFHRVLRGRTHDDGGDFWQWRDSMYAVAAALDPARYRDLAAAVFAEMLVSGYTAVGEFHYVHHRPDGEPYPDHAMELAVADAAAAVGIRLTLLDTCYLTGGIGAELDERQLRFSDRDVRAWIDRWFALRAAIGDRPGVTLGAAIHSVRAVSREDIAVIVAALPVDVPLHVHLSEQPQENADSIAAYGITPTEVLAEAGALTRRLTVVHATHLTDRDIELIGSAGSTVAMCPTTEADLGDGIGPGRRLVDAGAAIVLGSDQNAVVDPFLEARGLEAGERLGSGERGRFTPAALFSALSGYASLGLDGGIAVGALCDLVEIDTASVRTVGARREQLPLVATASDVLRVIVGARTLATNGRLSTPTGDDPAELLAAAIEHLESPA
jgi:formiminoglutamate deiminase